MGETEGVADGVTVRDGVKEGVQLGVAGLEGDIVREEDSEHVPLVVGVGEDVGETVCEPAAANKQKRKSADCIIEPLVSEGGGGGGG